jgi:hypothetical protein
MSVLMKPETDRDKNYPAARRSPNLQSGLPAINFTPATETHSAEYEKLLRRRRSINILPEASRSQKVVTLEKSAC